MGYSDRHAIPIRPAPPPIPPARTCQFPTREIAVGKYKFCGRKAAPGTSYCKKHHKLCHRPVPPRAAPRSVRVSPAFRGADIGDDR